MNPFQFPSLEGRILSAFPCLPNKKPLVKEWAKVATKNVKEFADMAQGVNDFLVGVPTGEISGFDVLDIDPDGIPWLKEQNSLFTRWHQTRRGGFHYLFKHRAGTRNSAGKIAPGVDVRGDGGFIIWWPFAGFITSNEDQLIEWPNEIYSLLLSRAKRASSLLMATPGATASFPGDTASFYESGLREWIKYDKCLEMLKHSEEDAEAIDECLQGWPSAQKGFILFVSRFSRESKFSVRAAVNAMCEIALAPEGQRNDTLNAKAYALGRLMARGWITRWTVARALWRGARDCNLVNDDGPDSVIRTIQSGLKAGLENPYPNLEKKSDG